MLIYIDNYKYARKIFGFSSGTNINTEKDRLRVWQRFRKKRIAYFC